MIQSIQSSRNETDLFMNQPSIPNPVRVVYNHIVEYECGTLLCIGKRLGEGRHRTYKCFKEFIFLHTLFFVWVVYVF